jgi:redox-sensitive bicupin YhaK (pirin superfamily)
MGFRSLRVLNDDRVAPGMGFGRHPHQNMEIVSLVLDGELEHGDDMGNGSVIRPGEVQRMSAGTGVRHSERNPSSKKPAHFLQIWIEPDKRGYPPSYEQRTIAPTAPEKPLALIASNDGREGSVTVHQDVNLWLARLREGQRATYALPPGRHAWVHVATGRATVNGEHLAEGDGVSLSDEARVELVGRADAQVLIFDLA